MAERKDKLIGRHGVAILAAAAFVTLWIVVLVGLVEAGAVSPSFIAGTGRWLGAAGTIAVALGAWRFDAEVRYDTLN